MKFRLEVKGELVGDDPLPLGRYTLGRSSSTIPLPFGVYIEGPKDFSIGKRIIAQSGSVSGNHLEITISEDSATLRDLDSTNGSYLNGERFEGEKTIDSAGKYSVKLGSTFILDFLAR